MVDNCLSQQKRVFSLIAIWVFGDVLVFEGVSVLFWLCTAPSEYACWTLLLVE